MVTYDKIKNLRLNVGLTADEPACSSDGGIQVAAEDQIYRANTSPPR